jgi:hypothetical protein
MLLVICCSASAEWSKFDVGQGIEGYIDLDNVQINGHLRRFWALTNRVSNDAPPGPFARDDWGSSRSLKELDCREKKWRTLQLHWFSESWARGKRVEGYPQSWEYIAPKTKGEELLRLICSR